MWKYFPRLPTKEAWDNRTFNDSLTIELVLKQLALHDNYLRGQVLFKLKKYRTIQFNSVKGLKYSLKEMEEAELDKNKIHIIYIYGIGYFRQDLK